jgi:aminoglycoside phosphotransferase (APT) family kinase protein
MLAVWERALAAPVWRGPPGWLHGDLHPGNMLVHEGRLSAIIDWGALGVGDPAVELMPAWNLFDARSRQVFRDAVGADDAMWDRGRGWALSMGVMALPYYRYTNVPFVEQARQTIATVLEEFEQSHVGA